MPSPSTLIVISLDGGVKSSVMRHMASQGAFDSMPYCAFFANTRWESPSVYTQLEWLEAQLSFPLCVVDNGRRRREDVKVPANHSVSYNFVDVPVYLKGSAGKGDVIGRRQ